MKPGFEVVPGAWHFHLVRTYKMVIGQSPFVLSKSSQSGPRSLKIDCYVPGDLIEKENNNFATKQQVIIHGLSSHRECRNRDS